MHSPFARRAARTLIASGLLFVFAPGCGGKHDYGPTGTIAGILSMDDKALPEGTKVVFMQHEEGFLAYGLTDAEGNFKVKSWNDGKMPVGKYKVMLQPAGAEDTENMTPDEMLERKGRKKKAPTAAPFPKRYRAITTSGLEYEVGEGENMFEIKIKSK